MHPPLSSPPSQQLGLGRGGGPAFIWKDSVFTEGRSGSLGNGIRQRLVTTSSDFVGKKLTLISLKLLLFGFLLKSQNQYPSEYTCLMELSLKTYCFQICHRHTGPLGTGRGYSALTMMALASSCLPASHTSLKLTLHTSLPPNTHKHTRIGTRMHTNTHRYTRTYTHTSYSHSSIPGL